MNELVEDDWKGTGRLDSFQGVPNDIFQKSVSYTIYYVFDA